MSWQRGLIDNFCDRPSFKVWLINLFDNYTWNGFFAKRDKYDVSGIEIFFALISKLVRILTEDFGGSDKVVIHRYIIPLVGGVVLL